MASFFQPVRVRILSALAAAGAVLPTSTALAHPGHGVTPDGDSAAHYLLEPVHGLGLVVGLFGVIACLWLVRTHLKGGVAQN